MEKHRQGFVVTVNTQGIPLVYGEFHFVQWFLWVTYHHCGLLKQTQKCIMRGGGAFVHFKELSHPHTHIKIKSVLKGCGANIH